MGSFLPLLGGLSEGASEAYGKYADEKRQTKTANDRLAANAILQDLKTNEEHTPEEQEVLQRHYFKLLGVDNKVADAVVAHSSYHRQAMAENARQAGYGKQQPELGGGTLDSAGGTIQGADGAPDVSLPPMPMAPTAGLPQIPAPPFQPKTSGQINFEESQPRVIQAEHDKAAAVRQEARDAAIGSIDDKIDILKKYDGTPMEQEVRQLVGAAPKGVGAKSRALAGTMERRCGQERTGCSRKRFLGYQHYEFLSSLRGCEWEAPPGFYSRDRATDKSWRGCIRFLVE